MSLVMKIQERGQVTLPKRLREDMGLKPGDSVLAVPDGAGCYRLERLEPMSFKEIVERWGSKDPIDDSDVERMIEEAREAEADEFNRKFLEE